MKKLLTAAALALSAYAGAAFAAPPADTTGTIKLYQRTNPSIVAVTEAGIKRFNARYPNVKVEVQWKPLGEWGEYISGFVNQVASGDVPDIYEVAIEGFSSVASKNLFLPLDEVIARDSSAKELLADIEPNLLKGMSDATGGKLYFFPTNWNNVVVFYNKDMFDAAGIPYPKKSWTWAEFLDAAQKLTKRDAAGQVTQYGYFVPGYNFGIAPWFLTNDTDKLKPGWKESNIRDPKFKESMVFLNEIIHKHKVAPNFARGTGEPQFVAKQVAMISAGHWPVPLLLQNGLKNVGVTMMPYQRKDVTVFGVGGLGITKGSKNPDLTWELVKELTGQVAQVQYAETKRSIPALRSIATTGEFAAFPDNSDLFYGSATTALPIAAPPNFSQVEEIFMRHVELYLTNNVAIDKMIGDLDAELTRAMRRVQ